MRAASVQVRDHRTVWGEPLDLRLGAAVTVLVGPNLAGKSNVVRALAAVWDDRLPFDLDRERPLHLPDVVPTVTVTGTMRDHGQRREHAVTVSWPDGRRTVEAFGNGGLLPGRPVLAWAEDRPADVLARLANALADTDLDDLATDLLPTLQRVLPEVGSLTFPDGVGGPVVVADRDGFTVADHTVRATFAAALGAHLVRRGADLPGIVVEEPEAFLHPAAQECLRDELLEVGVAAHAPVVVTTESPFVVPRVADARVIALARDDRGRTRVVGESAGDEPSSAVLGGLFRDGGIASVLDRTSRIPAGSTGVLVVEGGTDEAYLRIAAHVLGRADELETVAIQPAGGALPAALLSLVLRAETDLPVLVLFDNDDPGQRAARTLTDRFGFKKARDVTTYAEVVPDQPRGTEAEDMWDWRLVERFITEQGQESIRGKRILRADEWHFDLTLAAKSAFVAWLEREARSEDASRWAALLDVLPDRVGADARPHDR